MAILHLCLRRAARILKSTLNALLAPTLVIFRLFRRRPRYRLMKTAFSLATSRALESMRKDALFNDPLAKHFSPELPEDVVSSRKCQDRQNHRVVSYCTTRTKYFDDGLTAVLIPERALHPIFSDLKAFLKNTESDSCQQVVVIGSGFDSRPWRLPFNTARWFELDLPEVLRTKIRLLTVANASFSFRANIGSRYPLQCFSHSFAPGDVSKPSWIKRLRQRGLKESVCTVWLLEGLLVHLEPAVVYNLLQTMSQNSAVGSLLMVSIVTENLVKTKPSSKNEWKWGCPENASEFFFKYGWQIISLLPWTFVAEMYGCRPKRRNALGEPAQFLIAVKA